MTNNSKSHEKIREAREDAQKEKDRLQAAEERRLDDEDRPEGEDHPSPDVV